MCERVNVGLLACLLACWPPHGDGDDDDDVYRETLYIDRALSFHRVIHHCRRTCVRRLVSTGCVSEDGWSSRFRRYPAVRPACRSSISLFSSFFSFFLFPNPILAFSFFLFFST